MRAGMFFAFVTKTEEGVDLEEKGEKVLVTAA